MTPRDNSERELDRELAGYLKLLIEEKVRAGMSPEAARRAALIELGGKEQVKEAVRDVRRGVLFDSILQDLRYAARSLRRNPAFTLAAVAAIALGVGATSTIFSVVDSVLLRPLPYRAPRELVTILEDGRSPVSPADFADYRAQSSAFATVGAAEYLRPNLIAAGEERSEQVQGLSITPELLRTLGVPPRLGRLLSDDPQWIGGSHEVVISDGLWRRRYASRPEVTGTTLLVEGVPHTIVGVMPPRFDFPLFWAKGVDVWTPLALAARIDQRGSQSLRVFARLKPGVSIETARTEIAAITARLGHQFPGTNKNVKVTPLKDQVVGNVRPALLVATGAVALLLLLSCANVAHMLLARAAARQSEHAIRAALGASRRRLARQFLTESLVLSAAGGVAGLAVAFVAVRALGQWSSTTVPMAESIVLDAPVLLFTLGVSVLTGVLFGLAPPLHGSRGDLATTLPHSTRGTSEGGRGLRIRNALVASEFALALVLLAGASLLTRTFAELRAVDPGIETRNVLTMVVSLRGSGQESPGRRSVFYEETLRRVQLLQGVESASMINHLPLAGDMWGWPFIPEGRTLAAREEAPRATYRVVFPDYVRTMGMTLVRGRDVSEQDGRDAPPVALVNEHMAAAHWPGTDAIGKRLRLGGDSAAWLTIVGVTKNAVRGSWAEAPGEEIYLPYAQTPRYTEGTAAHALYMTLVVKARRDAAALAPAVRNVIAMLDRTVTISAVQTMEAIVTEEHSAAWLNFVVVGAFAVIALVLAAVGIYGVMSYAVARRTNEIGIRLALGADRRDVFRLVLGQAARLVGLGAGAGLAGALLVTQLMHSLLYGVAPRDPLSLGVAVGILVAIALLASYLPARRAMRVDPVTALRGE